MTTHTTGSYWLDRYYEKQERRKPLARKRKYKTPEQERAEAIGLWIRAFANKPDSIIYAQDIYDAKHRELQARYDVSARALREIKRKMAAEAKGKGVKKARAKRLTHCPHCHGDLREVST